MKDFMMLAFQDTPSINEQIRQLQEGYREGGGALWAVILCSAVIVVAAIVVVIVSRVQRRMSPEFVPNDPKRLFYSLLQRLGLAESQQAALEVMAKEMRLKHPTCLLLSPKLFDQAASIWRTRRAGEESQGVGGAVVEQLRERLFGA